MALILLSIMMGTQPHWPDYTRILYVYKALQKPSEPSSDFCLLGQHKDPTSVIPEVTASRENGPYANYLAAQNGLKTAPKKPIGGAAEYFTFMGGERNLARLRSLKWIVDCNNTAYFFQLEHLWNW